MSEERLNNIINELRSINRTQENRINIQKEEIKELKNIINELERHLEEQYLEWKDDSNDEICAMANEDKCILEKLRELKGDSSMSEERLQEIKDSIEFQYTLLEKLQQKDKEIERLNNIINELVKILNYDIDKSEEYMNKIRRSSLQQGDYPVQYYRAEWQKEKAIGYLDKLQELKGDSNE